MNKIDLANSLFFSKEAAEYLGITVQRLNKLVQEGRIKPLKKNASGTIFHIDELNKRREEQEIFADIKTGINSTFSFDTKEKREALNFATLMNVLDCTEQKLDPIFETFSSEVDTSILLNDTKVFNKYVAYFNIGENVLIKAFNLAEKAFKSLKATDEIIKRGSDHYPFLLQQTEQAPRFLYIRGKKSLLREKRTVALVGSRQASQIAKDNTVRVAFALGKNGITIVSGLAKGIDVTAHKAALDKGYNTIAVIGTNLNQYYPAENKLVQQEIEKRGLVISQFSPATKTKNWFFPMRNGVMSGISLATVIMEAGETSGALKQADFAIRQGRQILIPESALKLERITWPEKYVDKGAQVVKSPAEVIEKLAENNIFKLHKEESVQQTLEGYLQEKRNLNVVRAKAEWIDPITEEG